MGSTDEGLQPAPIILIRGFGGIGVEDEKRVAYQGFNDGTVYPQKRGENYIYEGLILRFMKSDWRYQDATNVIGYYGRDVPRPPYVHEGLRDLDQKGFFGYQGEDAEPPGGYKVVIDPAMALRLVEDESLDLSRTLWVFRYYDLDDREFPVYGRALVKLIDFIRELAACRSQEVPKVNIIAHSMGGLIVREAIQMTYPKEKGSPRASADYINKVVTLGTPHRGISFQLVTDLWLKLKAENEIEHFNPESQKDEKNPAGFKNLAAHFPLERFLTVVGTNYKTYGALSSFANRVFSVAGEFGPTYNRSDGLVKQTNATIPNAPRTFVHKCHGGQDSLVTSREAYEIARRFFFGDVRARLRLQSAQVLRGKDRMGKSEYFFGISVKPRRVDFDLFHQSAEAENCYGPFHEQDLSDRDPRFGWAGEDRLIWEGYLDSSHTDPERNDLVMRLDFYVGERDAFGIGFSDNVIFRQQYYVRAVAGDPIELQLHSDEGFDADPSAEGTKMTPADGGWLFDVDGPGFRGTVRAEIELLRGTMGSNAGVSVTPAV